MVSLPFDIVDEDVKESPAIPTFSFSILCEDSSVQEVASWLTGGSKVAIVAGYEVDVYMAHEELRTLAERISATVFAEPNAHRSPFYSSHPLFEGDLPWEADEMLKKLSVYDRILIVGGTLNFLTPPTEKDFKLNIFQVTSDPEEAEKRKWNTICCNVKEFLTKLNSALPRSSISLKIETERPKPVGTTIINFLEELASNSQDREKFAEASSLMGEIRRTMGYFPSRFFGLKSGLLGWSLTAAVGAALEGARPLVLIGDGGFHYSCQSLWTASNYGATELRAVVFNNRGYEILRRHFRDEPWLSPLTSPYKVAEAYGVEAKKVGLKEASKEISWLVRGKGPKLLQVDFA
ncbi:thiamine pyrophosphate-dependent enzyme [Sulfodiicoccus acidiphilus]|uniref:thiamine pyrophosphate-dependent enzyme n=1 Tax=Sulfodiicoccus acidiphilus TaxID=1670455 RepID=UPI001662E7C9|nr:thiamine pyrophosphate-dependent enzyme [Sulfodiicoccus acidiphilus]